MVDQQATSYPASAPFPGIIGDTVAQSEPAWPESPAPPRGTPNVVFIVLDDLGFAQLGCFGGLGGRIRTPNIDRLAAGGVRFNDFHVAPMCSPTRASLLTGRNHHAVGVGLIMEILSGYPGYNGRIPKETAMLPAILSEYGFSSWAAGKWHLAPNEEVNPIGPMDRWPLRQGFDRFYGFMTGGTDQYRPSMWEDNRYLGVPAAAAGTYHLTEDIIDRSIEWVAQLQAIAPDRPFFHYLSPGAMHQPHQVPEEWVTPYNGVFADGWDAIREQTLAHQKAMGIVPEDTELPPANPGSRPWDSLSNIERQLVERQMEVYAGFLEHTDHHIGRFLNVLEQHGVLDNTLIMLMSDNGASGEGTELGLSQMTAQLNGEPESLDEKLMAIDGWAGPDQFSHYATGWAMAGNTPNRWYKRMTHEGGTRSPLIVHWPDRISDGGRIRSQFHHVTDVVPTVLECLDLDMPGLVRGYPQRPLEGISFAYALNNPSAPTQKQVQYFEMLGHRAIWKDGWKAVTAHMTTEAQQIVGSRPIQPPQDGDFEGDKWELYHLDSDYSESNDLASVRTDILEDLKREWWQEARKFGVLPLDDRFTGRYLEYLPTAKKGRSEYVYYGPLQLTTTGSPNLKNVDHSIVAEVTIPEGGANGTIVSDGGRTGGFALGVHEGCVYYVSNFLGRTLSVARTPSTLPAGRHRIRVEFAVDRSDPDARIMGGTVQLFVDSAPAVAVDVSKTNPLRYNVSTEGLRIGSDAHGVWPEVAPPALFTGEIHEVRITRRAERAAQNVATEHEMEAALAEQ